VLLTNFDKADLALLTKWPVFLKNTFGNLAYVNQKNFNGKLGKKWGGQTGGQAKIWGGHGPPKPPRLESPLAMLSIEASCLRSLDLDDINKVFHAKRLAPILFHTIII